MCRSNLRKLLESEKQKFTEGANIVTSKRHAWNDFADLAFRIFSEVKEEGKKLQLFDNLYVQDSRKDKATENMPNFIILFWGSHPVGFSTIDSDKKLAVEEGCTLTFSQSVFGDIVCVMYPFKSELHQRQERYFILNSPHHPHWYTEERILKYLKYFFSYSQVSSYIGKPSLVDKYRIRKLVIIEKWRKLNKSKAISALIDMISSVVKKSMSTGA